jgi:hypothetical protein
MYREILAELNSFTKFREILAKIFHKIYHFHDHLMDPVSLDLVQILSSREDTKIPWCSVGGSVKFRIC